MFSERDALVADEMFEHCSESVTYARGGTTRTVDAVIGLTQKQGGDWSSAHNRYESRTWYIKASALSAFTEPAEEDTITIGSDVWEVMVPDGVEKPWRYCDAARTVMQIFTWRGSDL